jgi:hypothetical protein
VSEAPEAEDSQDGEEAEDSLEGTSSSTSPSPALSEDLGLDKKRKRVEEFLSSSTSTHKNVADAGRITTQLGTPRGRYDEHSSKSFPQ